jgi:formylmethanofuran dehydrogenase subunit D
MDIDTGNTVHVKGDRVVVTTEKGGIVFQFKNAKANTPKRILEGKWVQIHK